MEVQKQMKIEFKDKKKIVTHPSGHVDEYDKAHLEVNKKELEERKAQIGHQIDLIVNDISRL